MNTVWKENARERAIERELGLYRGEKMKRGAKRLMSDGELVEADSDDWDIMEAVRSHYQE